MSKVKEVLSAFSDAGFYTDAYWKEEFRMLAFRDKHDPYHDFCIEEENLELVGLFLLDFAKALKDDTPATSPPALP